MFGRVGKMLRKNRDIIIGDATLGFIKFSAYVIGFLLFMRILGSVIYVS